MNRAPEHRLPEHLSGLFWDIDPEAIDTEQHADYVMDRIMTRGTWAAMRWLRERYDSARRAEFLRRRGATRLAPRELAYWALVSGVRMPIGRGGGRPSWAG